MIHAVLFRFRQTAEPSQIGAALNELETMCSAVDGVRHLRSVLNLAMPRPAAHGYTHCVMSDVRDAAALNAWMEYSPHIDWGQRYVTAEDPLIESLISVDLDGF